MNIFVPAVRSTQTKLQRTFITHEDRSFYYGPRIACLAYLSVSIIYENLAEIYEFIYTTASTHFSFIDTLVRNKNSSVYIQVEFCEYYEGQRFNSGNYLFTTDTKQIHVSKFYCPSMQSPALCTTRCQRCGKALVTST